MTSLHPLGQDNRNKVQHDFSCYFMPLTLAWASHDPLSILNLIITFLRSKQSKLDVSWHFGPVTQRLLALASYDATFMLHDTIRFSISVTWYQQHDKWDPCFPQVKIIEMICNMSLLVMWHHWLQHHIMSTTLSIAPFHFLDQGNSNEVQHIFLGHVIPLVPVSCDGKWQCKWHHSFLR